MLTTLKNWWHQEEVCTLNPDLELSVTKLMVGMMTLDGSIDSEEKEEISHLLNVRFGLSDDEAQDLVIQAMDDTRTDLTFTKVVKHIEANYSQQDRINVLSHVWRVALADGEVDFVEERYINRLSGLIGVSADELHQLKQEQEKHVPELDNSKRFQNPNLQI